VAEKFHAMVLLGSINSRMKDFYDVWFLSRHYDFGGKLLAEAISQTFLRRKTVLEANPTVFQSHFLEDVQKQTQWQAFIRKGQLMTDADSFSAVVEEIKNFIQPLLQALTSREAFMSNWQSQHQLWSP
jgi:hypothetical protein